MKIRDREAEEKQLQKDLGIDLVHMATMMHKLGYDGGVNEMFYALMDDMGMSYNFPYKKWVSSMEGKDKMFVELMCRMSSRDTKKQGDLLKLCLKNKLIEESRMRPFTETELVEERLFFMMHMLPTVSSLENVLKAMGIIAKVTTCRNSRSPCMEIRNHTTPTSILNTYFPKGQELTQLLKSEKLTMAEKKLICVYYVSSNSICTARKRPTDEEYTISSDATTSRYADRQTPSFDNDMSVPEEKKGLFARLRRK